MVFNDLFANYLLNNNILTDKTLKSVCEHANNNNVALYTEIVKSNILDEETIYQHLAKFCLLEYRFMQISELELNLVKDFSLEKIIELKAIPIEINEKMITLLISNPFHIDDIEQLKYMKDKELKYVLTTSSQMERLLEYISTKIQQNDVIDNYGTKVSDITETSKGDISIDAPVIKLCDSILKEAVTRNASDIHIEPYEKKLVVRYRLDGALKVISELQIHFYQAILARYKIMANMNIAERRVPQDGKINLNFNDKNYDFRVSTLPTIHGEKIVIRIYNSDFTTSDISSLGFTPTQENIVYDMINRPHGIILLTGPTGSGKSTTLYTFLRYLNKEDTNIITVEDPVENEISGIAQVQVNAKANLTFASALRSILRQDPNIIMIGEIRDEETAQIATRAAITGHLVLSSIHTNDVASVVTRLINMGIPKYLVADSLLGAISQRLVRKVCPKCGNKRFLKIEEKRLLNVDKDCQIIEPKGCPYCNGTGYLGRIGVFEMMVLTDEIRNYIMSDNYTSEGLSEVLKKNNMTILDHVKQRVLNFETTIEEYEKLNSIVLTKNTNE